MYITRVKGLLTEDNADRLFPCIVDLLTNGLSVDRFADDDQRPTRQDVTQYLAAWCRFAGLSAEETRAWLIEYCIDKLSTISSSSGSQIRHSTKSNIKYIFNSNVTFECLCEKNKCKATCDSACPVFDEMTEKAKEREKARIEAAEHYEVRAEDRTPVQEVPAQLSAKEEYKEQFDKAMEIAQQHLKKWASRKEVVNRLNADGFKSRTGKPWTTSILGLELKKLRAKPDDTDNR